MTLFILRRICVAITQILVVTTLVFLGIHLVPGDPAELLLSQGGTVPSPAAIDELRQKLGLNLPLWQQYTTYLGNISRGELGTSLIDDHSISFEILLRLPRTLELVAVAGILSLIVGLPLGTLAALWPRSWLDRVANLWAATSLSVPVFVFGTLSILIFAQILGWVPAGGFVPFSQSPLRHLGLLLLPASTIAIGLAAVVFRTTRSAVLEMLNRDHVRAAQARGLHPLDLVMRHVCRNALSPVATVFGLQLGALLGGTVLVEFVYNWPGLSGYLVQAVDARDYPEVLGVVLVISSMFVVLNLTVDLLHAFLDPRVRLG